jgi:hypothetical protein
VAANFSSFHHGIPIGPDSPSPHDRREQRMLKNSRKTLRRLTHAMLFALARGAAYTAGAAAITALLWWAQRG